MKKVSVLGTVHGAHESEFQDVYSLHDLEEAIRRIQPEVVLAEVPPGWKEQFGSYEQLPDFMCENKRAIFPLSEELGYEVIPVDQGSGLYAYEFRKWEQEKHQLVEFGEIKYKLYYEIDEVIFRAIPRVFKSVKEIQSEACSDIMQVLMDMDTLWFFKNKPELDYWEKHNEANYRIIMDAVRSSPQDSFLITFGLQHKYWFENRLKQEQDIQFVPVTEYL